jgi:small subunit ribosomal protein S11
MYKNKNISKIKKRKKINIGIANILATFNNTIVTISDTDGSVLAWSSSGHNGFKGSKKSTPYAAQITSENVARKVIALGMHTVSVKIQGPGSGRDSSIRGLVSSGLNVTSIHDVTPVPHNGCRPPKQRRV